MSSEHHQDDGPALTLLRERITANLSRFTPLPQVGVSAGIRRAAVVVCLLERGHVPHFVLLKRTSRGRNPGQWALPGGRLDHDEDPVAAGLRELREETCLVAEPHDIIGVLDNFVTDSGFLITPLVIVPPRQRKPRRAPAEIHSIHPVAVEALTAPGVPRWSRLPDGRPLLQMPLRRGLVVHAPTGAILWQFAEVGLRGRQTRVQNLVQPAFTRH